MNEVGIAKTLAKKRKEKGITQDDLASYIGVSKASVSKWETGQSYPDITFLPQLASYFNISVDELISYHPQMIKDDIGKLYLRLSKDFALKAFDDVMGEIRNITKKYYSCFPLLFQMGTLIINHYMLAEKEEQQGIIREAIEIFVRIKSESDDFALCKRSNIMEAVAYLCLGEPENIIELLGDCDLLSSNEGNILSVGYSMTGKTDKAREVLQVEAYQNLMCLMQNLTCLLQLETENPKKAKVIIDRMTNVSKVFDLDSLHPATMLSVYFNFATVYAGQNDTDSAICALQKYCDVATGSFYPITIHGDSFFDRIENWLRDISIGIDAPRDEKTIKQSIVDSVENNPVFSSFSKNVTYKNILKKLKANLGG